MEVNFDQEMTLHCDHYPDEEQPCNSTECDKIDFTNVHERRGVIFTILNDFLEDDTAGLLGRGIAHVGFDVRAIRYPAELPAAWLGHYHKGRGYDCERALNDLVTWTPFATLIAMPAENENDAACEKEHSKSASE